MDKKERKKSGRKKVREIRGMEKRLGRSE